MPIYIQHNLSIHQHLLVGFSDNGVVFRTLSQSLEVLILILAASYSVANRPSACWVSWLKDAYKTSRCISLVKLLLYELSILQFLHAPFVPSLSAESFQSTSTNVCIWRLLLSLVCVCVCASGKAVGLLSAFECFLIMFTVSGLMVDVFTKVKFHLDNFIFYTGFNRGMNNISVSSLLILQK